MTSFNLNYLLKVLPPNTVTLGGKGLHTCEFRQGHDSVYSKL